MTKLNWRFLMTRLHLRFPYCNVELKILMTKFNLRFLMIELNLKIPDNKVKIKDS